jgi:hydroxypyruvate isomerase
MPKFCANLTMLYNEVPFLDRFAAAARAGFKAVEFLFPYEFSVREINDALAANGLSLVLHNLPAGDWGAGERGIACHPMRVNEFREGVSKAIEYATALGCPRVNCLAGIAPPEDGFLSREILISNLAFAAEELKKVGIELLLEPVNTRDIPNFFVHYTKQALEIIDQDQSNNLRLQFDIYHAQVMEGDLARSIESHLDRIGHIQLADNPGRNEPGTGEINYQYLFKRIDELGYTGWIGCEYKPRAGTTPGLSWFEQHGVSTHGNFIA